MPEKPSAKKREIEKSTRRAAFLSRFQHCFMLETHHSVVIADDFRAKKRKNSSDICRKNTFSAEKITKSIKKIGRRHSEKFYHPFFPKILSLQNRTEALQEKMAAPCEKMEPPQTSVVPLKFSVEPLKFSIAPL